MKCIKKLNLLFLIMIFSSVLVIAAELEEDPPVELLENIEFFEGMDMMDDFDFLSYAPVDTQADTTGTDNSGLQELENSPSPTNTNEEEL